jgi:DNA helicase-2/ATP-dependent DNA helicase PcrA
MSVVESSGLAFQLSAADALDVAVNIRNCLKSNLNCEVVPENAREILAAANFEQLVESASWSVTETGNRIANSNHLLNDITNVSSQSNLNLKEAISRLAGRGAVQVLTGQESKGREFNQVFLIGLEEGLIPDKRANTEETLAEERRIFYVALTRAKSAAYLSSLAQRNTPWNTTQKITPSRFLKSIPPELINQFPNK